MSKSALYNLRSAGEASWRVTKFDEDLNVESSYTVSSTACECPAGQRPGYVCRHRQMLPQLWKINDLAAFLDFDTRMIITEDGAIHVDVFEPNAGEGAEPSTLAAARTTTPSESGRGQPAPASALSAAGLRRLP